MHPLSLTQPEFQQVLRVAQRVLLNDFTPAVDIRSFLVARLQEDYPEAASKIANSGDEQIRALWEQVAAATRVGADSTLWT